LVPRCEGLAVAAGVLAVATDCEQHETFWTAVHELAAHLRRHADELAAGEHRLLALDQERERPLEHQIDLLLALVTMDAAALARLEHDEVHAECRHAELPAKRREALIGVGRDARPGSPCLHDAILRVVTGYRLGLVPNEVVQMAAFGPAARAPSVSLEL
jgi:hypothetical protein